MRIVCISDTHTLQDNMTADIPEGDVLLHAGDVMNSGYDASDIFYFLDWFGALPHKHKIFIAGNHDRLFENDPKAVKDIIDKKNGVLKSSKKKKITYLEDSEIVIDGVKFYGSPYQPEFCNWAFNVNRGPDIKRVWDKIPLDTDVLITHGPPYGILDWTEYDRLNVGCEMLMPKILEVKPKIHLFGHIHEAYGVKVVDDTTFVNASICTLRYRPINKPIVFDYHPENKLVVEVTE